jgi:hypothetical protein
MTTGNTTLLGLALPVEGELDGTWGDVVNDSITSLLDSAVAGTTTLSADIDVELTTTVLAANQARQAIIRWTASNGATTRNITAPARSKAYIVINAGTGSIVLRGAGTPPTTGITVVAGERCVAAWNGSDFVKVASSVADGVTSVAVSGGTTGLTTSGGPITSSGTITLAGTLAPTNGGTGLTTVGGNGQVLTVVSGAPAWAASATGIPSQAGNAGKYLTTDGTNPSWTSTGAAAGGGIYVNNDVISQDYTIVAGQNGFSVGPMTISDGYAITVSSGQRWVII